MVEDVLIKNGSFSLAGKKSLSDNNSNYKTVLIDVTESPIQRPQKTKILLLGKKKQHTIKTLLVVDKTGAVDKVKFLECIIV